MCHPRWNYNPKSQNIGRNIMMFDLGLSRRVWMVEGSHLLPGLLSSALLPRIYLKEDNLMEKHWRYWPGSPNKPLPEPSESATHSWKGLIGWWWKFMAWNFFLEYSITRNKREWHLCLTLYIPDTLSWCSEQNTVLTLPRMWQFSPGRTVTICPFIAPNQHFSLLLGQYPEFTPNKNREVKIKAPGKKKKRGVTQRKLLIYIIINLGNACRSVDFECAWPRGSQHSFRWGCIYYYGCRLAEFRLQSTDCCCMMNCFFRYRMSKEFGSQHLKTQYTCQSTVIYVHYNKKSELVIFVF